MTRFEYAERRRQALWVAEDRRSRDLRNLAIVALSLLYALVNYYGVDELLGAGDADAQLVAHLSTVVDDVGLFDSYAATAWVYGALPDWARTALEIAVAATFLITLLRMIRGAFALSIASFLALAPILLFLSLFTKETILLLFIISAYVATQAATSNAKRFTIIVFLYGGYAVIFRQYYLLIIAALGFLLVFRASNNVIKVLIVALSLGVLWILPSDIYRGLNDARDAVNYPRMGFGDEANRSAFMNPHQSPTFAAFAQNYLYAAARLNLPVLFNAGIKEAFLMINTMFYFILVGIGLFWGNERTKFATLVFVSHIAVLTIFEPDLGSYLRHAGTALVFLAPAIMTLDRLLAVRKVLGRVLGQGDRVRATSATH